MFFFLNILINKYINGFFSNIIKTWAFLKSAWGKYNLATWAIGKYHWVQFIIFYLGLSHLFSQWKFTRNFILCVVLVRFLVSRTLQLYEENWEGFSPFPSLYWRVIICSSKILGNLSPNPPFLVPQWNLARWRKVREIFLSNVAICKVVIELSGMFSSSGTCWYFTVFYKISISS